MKSCIVQHPDDDTLVAPPRGERGLKFGHRIILREKIVKVAPPRGERGLKCAEERAKLMKQAGRSPSWGAWIEIVR